ncbi:MAG: hypothetical protein VCD00_00670 [Candidatus Hydrogenedentota bacterium]
MLNGLETLDFKRWTESDRDHARLALECFPAEAIWAMKRLGQYPENLSASEVKEYKKQKGSRISALQVEILVHRVLDEFSSCSVYWDSLVEQAVKQMLASETF